MICRLGVGWKALLNENSGNMIFDAVYFLEEQMHSVFTSKREIEGVGPYVGETPSG